MASATPSLIPAPAPNVTGANVSLRHASQVNRVQIGGKNYNITKIEMMVNGKWEEVNLKKYTLEERSDLIQACLKVHTSVIGNDAKNAKTLTYYFEMRENEKQPISAKFFDKFKKKSVAVIKIESQTKDGKTQVHNLENYTPEIHAKVQLSLGRAEAHLKKIFSTPENYLQGKKTGPKLETIHALIDQTVQESGSLNNRCAARSIAKKELAAHANHLEKIITKYALNSTLTASLNAAQGEDAQITLLSEALIAKAAAIIGWQDATNPFLTQGPTIDPDSERAPCFQAIQTALEAHKAVHTEFDIPHNPFDAVASYACLMLQDGTMLDLPFFLALKQPFIILQKFGEEYKVVTTSSGLDRVQIQGLDLTNVNIVVYNGTNHYKAIIPKTPAQKDALKKLFFTHRAMDEIEKNDYTPACVEVTKNLLITYPKSRNPMIFKLKQKYPGKFQDPRALQALLNARPADFARVARQAIGKSTILIEEIN